MTNDEMKMIKKLIADLRIAKKKIEPILKREDKKYFNMDPDDPKEEKQENLYRALDNSDDGIQDLIIVLREIKPVK